VLREVTTEPLPEPPSGIAQMEVSSSRFTNGEVIFPRFTCDGVNLSPDFQWSGVPPTAVTLAIIMDDPEAPSGGFTHWLVYDPRGGG
jgi:phosphatidylethanolamine-binding protein (PEBP) family uncharacterized protein